MLIKKATGGRSFGIAVGIMMLLLLLVSGAGAVPIEQWNKTFGGASNDYGYSAQQTSDGGYILAGQKHIAYPSGATGADAWLIKTDANGTEQWNQTYGTGNDIANFVQQTSDGGYIAVGWIASSATGVDAWLIKTDANGKEQWNRTYGGVKYNDAYFVQQTSDGGYVLVGGTYSYGGTNDAWVIKTNSSGTEQWNKTYLVNTRAHSVKQTSDGGYIVSGWTYPWGASYNSDAYLLKIDSNGTEQWNNTYGRGGYEDTASSVQQTSDGGYAFAGWTSSYGAGGTDAWLVKTDAKGKEQWNRTFGGTNNDYAYSIQQTSDGGYILDGWTTSYGAGYEDAWLVKANSSGYEQWNMTFGGAKTDQTYSVQQTSDGGYVLAGNTQSYGAGANDAWLIKVSKDTNTSTPSALSNSGGGSWQYYKNLTISNPGGALSNYQVLVNLTGNSFPIEANQSGADIRFTDAGGVELNYWIESWDYANRSAKIWVNVTSITANGNTTIRMYYQYL